MRSDRDLDILPAGLSARDVGQKPDSAGRWCWNPENIVYYRSKSGEKLNMDGRKIKPWQQRSE
jgi:hypothetical protein